MELPACNREALSLLLHWHAPANGIAVDGRHLGVASVAKCHSVPPCAEDDLSS